MIFIKLPKKVIRMPERYLLKLVDTWNKMELSDFIQRLPVPSMEVSNSYVLDPI